jgi:hypothetical protein
MKSFAKSLVMAVMGTGLFFCFLMMITIPVMALLARLNINVAKSSVVVSPAVFLRTFGIPVAVVLFVVLFAMGLRRFRRDEHGALPVRH